MATSLIKMTTVVIGAIIIAACVSRPRIQFEPAQVGANCEAGFEYNVAQKLLQLNKQNQDEYYNNIYKIMLSVANEYDVTEDEQQDIAKVLFNNYIHCLENKRT